MTQLLVGSAGNKQGSQAAGGFGLAITGNPGPILHYPDLDPALNVWPAVPLEPPATSLWGPSLLGGPIAQVLTATAGSAVSFVRAVGYALAGTAGSSAALMKAVGLIRAVSTQLSAVSVRSVGLSRSVSAGGLASLAERLAFARTLSAAGGGLAMLSLGIPAAAARVFAAVARTVQGLVQPRPSLGGSGSVSVVAVARVTTAYGVRRTMEVAAGARPLTFVAVAP